MSASEGLSAFTGDVVPEIQHALDTEAGSQSRQAAMQEKPSISFGHGQSCGDFTMIAAGKMVKQHGIALPFWQSRHMAKDAA